MRLALYQPEIAQNTGTLLRLCACMGIQLDIIEPCGFGLSDPGLKRAGMDYVELASYRRHESWEAFRQSTLSRVVLLTPHTELFYTAFTFRADDVLLLGQESSGVPHHVHHACEAAIRIPMSPGRRSLNVAIAGAMVLGEALRQTGLFPEMESNHEPNRR
ncbi:MAG: tRNA (cytidine(34)-2'-O)-methyltransferase [Holosporales bacterium]